MLISAAYALRILLGLLQEVDNTRCNRRRAGYCKYGRTLTVLLPGTAPTTRVQEHSLFAPAHRAQHNFFVAIKIITNMVVFLIFLLRSRFSYLLLQRPLQLTSGNQKGQREAPPIPRNTPRGQPRACSLYMGPIHRGNKQNRPSRLYCPPRRRGPVSRGCARCSSAVGMFL